MSMLTHIHAYRPIQSLTPLYGPVSILKLGIYDKLPVPEWESFACRRQEWEVPIEGAVQYKMKSKGDLLPGSPEVAAKVVKKTA